MTNNTKVIRGGSWFNDYNWILRCSRRDHDPATLRANNVGFRLVGKLQPVPRVLRGGAWYSSFDFCRCAIRLRSHPFGRDDVVGFRLVGTCTKRLEQCDE